MSAAPAAIPGDYQRSLHFDGRDRQYLLHVPEACRDATRVPVVLVFHGGGSNAADMVRFCRLNDVADREGFITVYPEGTGRIDRAHSWNGGNCCGHAQRHNVDDVGFVSAILDELPGLVPVDSRRVYATGMSNGAVLSYLLASKLSDRIAAIAPVGGPMGTRSCDPSRPISILHFHGTADEFAPFAGGRGARSLSQTEFFSVEHTIATWVRANGCPKEPRLHEELPVTVDDGLQIFHTEYGPGREGAEVVLYVIAGGGHTWPGEEPTYDFLGAWTRQISANELMWAFFQRHALPG